MSIERAQRQFREKYSDDCEALTAAFKQLVDVSGQLNATVLQLTRLREAVKALDDAEPTPSETLPAWDKIDQILREPLPTTVPNAGSEALKEQAQRIRELEIANAGFRTERDHIVELEAEVSRLKKRLLGVADIELPETDFMDNPGMGFPREWRELNATEYRTRVMNLLRAYSAEQQ